MRGRRHACAWESGGGGIGSSNNNNNNDDAAARHEVATLTGGGVRVRVNSVSQNLPLLTIPSEGARFTHLLLSEQMYRDRPQNGPYVA